MVVMEAVVVTELEISTSSAEAVAIMFPPTTSAAVASVTEEPKSWVTQAVEVESMIA